MPVQVRLLPLASTYFCIAESAERSWREMSQISQREARRLLKRVEALETERRVQRRSWATEYPGGTHIDTIEVQNNEWHIVSTARKLGHAVVVVPDKENFLRVYGLRLPSE